MIKTCICVAALASCADAFAPAALPVGTRASASKSSLSSVRMAATEEFKVTSLTTPKGLPDHDILLRVAKGEKADRTPVWLMRQAGRYMKDFKAYSNKYPFRMRSETPDIAIELSLQPFR